MQNAFTVADRYADREIYKDLFGVPKLWPGERWVHLVHNWRTGGSSLTALLSVNVHDSYLKVGHPFTRDGWPLDYAKHPQQITQAGQLREWIQAQHSPGILAGHTYFGMAEGLSLPNAEHWFTLREPAARMNSGLLRFYRKALRNDHPDGGYVGTTQAHTFQSAAEIEQVARTELSHELNGMCRRLAGYTMLPRGVKPSGDDNLESCAILDQRQVDRDCFEKALAHLEQGAWLYLTEHVLPSIMLLEATYGLKPLIHPCSDLVHNPQWNGAGITRLQQSLLLKHRGLLESLNHWDVKLYSEAQRLFWKRWREADIDPKRLEARRILQGKPLLPLNRKYGPGDAGQVILGKISYRADQCDSSEVSSWIRRDGENALFWPNLNK